MEVVIAWLVGLLTGYLIHFTVAYSVCKDYRNFVLRRMRNDAVL